MMQSSTDVRGECPAPIVTFSTKN